MDSLLCPRFSVVIPAYNVEGSICKSLNSIMNQTLISAIDEIIIVDDGSTDKTMDVIKKYKEKSKFRIKIIHQTNKGVSSARNAGIKISRSKWIALLDADDTWVDTKIEKVVSCIQQHPEIHFLGTNRVGSNVTFGARISRGLYRIDMFRLLVKMWPCTPSWVFRKESLDKVGYFDVSQRYCEDGNMLIRFAHHFGVYYLQEQLLETNPTKPMYGGSGLSANLKGMHEGCIENIDYAYKWKYINTFYRKLFIVLENIKYIKRLCITNLKKVRLNEK